MDVTMDVTREPRYDLHTHSTHSDGTTAPAQIAELAKKIGLRGFSLTDHDTTAGWAEARVAATAHGIEFLPGMELTTRHDGRSTHLLAYGVDPTDAALGRELARLIESRIARSREMMRRLSADFPLDWAALDAATAGRTVGRPHLADALVDAGYYPDRSAAFADVLRPDSPYYVPTFALDTLDAVRLVRDAGGVAVLAHPAAVRQRRVITPAALADLVTAGLWGIELAHPENRAEWVPDLRRHAESHGLVVTGASDYHGSGKPNRLGECTSSAEVWGALRAAAAVVR